MLLRLDRMLRGMLLVAAGLAALGLGACSDYAGNLPKHMRPLDAKVRDLIERKGMDQRAPILIRIFKEEATLEVWKLQAKTGRYAFLKDYEICAWSGVLGPKIREGDRQAPEGFYTIRPAQMNPNSNYYLAFNMGYPNEFDRSLGRTGSELMVHGACSSRGCYSMTDENIQEIYTLGRLAFTGGQRDFQVQAFPFRMTPENLARHRNDPNMPFWLMLKEGYDHFELLGQPPKVNVCEHRYIFDADAAEGRSFNASAQCPPMTMPERVRIAAQEKQARDNAQMLAIAERLDKREGRDGLPGLRLALATPSTADRAEPLPMSLPTTPIEIASVPSSLAPTTTASVAPDGSAAPADGVAPAAVAAVEAQPALAPPSAAAAYTPPAPARAPQPGAVAAVAPSAPAAPKPAPQPAPAAETSVDSAFLPVPELRSGEVETSAPAAPPSAAANATLAERMLAGSTPADASVANAYADASAEDDGLTGMVLKLMKKRQEDAPTN